MQDEDLRKKAIIDANINRAAEGLRVVEDWARFYMRNEELTLRLRSIRHLLWDISKSSYPQIIKGRNTGSDILSESKEGTREKEEDIPRASLNRVKEALRVLEEFAKLISRQAGGEFKKMRFEMYNIEEKFYE
ncbi:MAG: thiamine-phosphate pyrophosphorylase [Elusimicrobiota bacterium]